MSYIAYNIKADLTKHSMLNPVRLSAKCYDKHFAIFILMIHRTYTEFYLAVECMQEGHNVYFMSQSKSFMKAVAFDIS